MNTYMKSLIYQLVFWKIDFIYRIFANSFRGNYSFLEVGVRQVFKGGIIFILFGSRNYSREQIIQVQKLFSIYLLTIVHVFIIKPNMVLVTLSFLFLASSSDTIQSMRYANSLESLDAVSTSIQQGTIHILRKHFLGFFVPPPPLHKCIFF